MTLTRRRVLSRLGLAALGLAAGCRRAPAGDGLCPALAGGRIRWIVPNAPGGGYDTESRLLQPFLERVLDADIAVANMPGAGGLIGAGAIAGAVPDGRTVGIVGLPGLLVSSLLGEPGAIDVRGDLTMLARVSRSAHVWAVGPSSPLVSIDDVLEAGRTRPIVFGVNEVGSTNFVGIVVASALLGLTPRLVPGFEGTRAASLAAARGDVDLVCFNFETIQPLMEAGDLRPILQLDDVPVGNDPLLAGVPLLGGAEGLAASLARSAGRAPEEARATAAALAHVVGSGRVVVGPAGLDDSTRDCWSDALLRAVDDVSASVARTFDPASGRAVSRDVEAAAREAVRLQPLLSAALDEIRGGRA